MLELSLVLNVILFVWLIIIANKMGYYCGKANEDTSGWEDEAKFWRNVYKPAAEEKRIENGSY